MRTPRRAQLVILYPAVDIRGGQAVRLVKGDFNRETVYGADPAAAAQGWVEEGARALHVVDLDGAREGAPANLHHLERIATLGVPVQFGGGLRSLATIERALEAGAERVVLGTAAFTDQEMLREALRQWPGKVVVSVDARGGRAATEGWRQSAGATAEQAAEEMVKHGVEDLVYTDVDRDGMLQGPDLEGVRAVGEAARGARIICSGGVGALEHLEALAALREPELAGVIVGKALYERRFTVAEALKALEGAGGG